MSEEQDAPKRRTLKLALRLGETVAVLGLILAGVSFFVGRADREEQARAEQAQRASAAAAQAEGRRRAAVASRLVLRAEQADEGARLYLSPADPGQVIQSQRYVFPAAVRETAREISAGRPQIDRDWVQDGLLAERRRLADAGREPASGEQRLPVGVVTTFIDDGETRTDVAIYRIGYGVARGALGRSHVELQGAALMKRTRAEDLQAEVDALWAEIAPAG